MFELPFLVNRIELEGSEADIQGKIQAIDNIHLAYTAYIPRQVDYCVIFYHGGGANHLSYTGMAQSLRDTSHIATFLFDIRGHGLSDGHVLANWILM